MMWADKLRGMGFRPLCKANPDLWMRSKGKYFEYISVMVDDLILFSRSHQPELTIASIIYLFSKYDLKGVGEPEYLLHTHLDDPLPMITPSPSIPPEPPPSLSCSEFMSQLVDAPSPGELASA